MSAPPSGATRKMLADYAVDDQLREWRPRLVDFIVYQIDDPNDAEDVVQEVLLRAFLYGVDKIENPAAWLRRVASRQIINRHRRQTAERRGGANTRTVPAAEFDEDAVWTSVTYVVGEQDADEYFHVRERLRQLGYGARYAAYLLIFERESEKEVAVEMGVSLDDVANFRKEIEMAIFGPPSGERPAEAQEGRPM